MPLISCLPGGTRAHYTGRTPLHCPQAPQTNPVILCRSHEVSVPTLRKMERGDPTVSISVYAMALWLIGRVQFLAEIANPVSDEMALLLELRNLSTQQKGTSR